MVAHNCHGKRKNLTTKRIRLFLFAVRFFLSAVRFFLLPWGFFFCREVFSFDMRFFLLPQGYFFCRGVITYAVTVKGHCTNVRPNEAWEAEEKIKESSPKKSTSLSTKPYTYIDSFAWHRPREVAETIFQGVTTHLQGSSKLICSCVQN